MQQIAITQLFKSATPVEEAGQRMVYLEASNEALDAQGEVVLQKALADAAPYFLRYGNLDIDHYTQVGAKRGIKDFNNYEIGRPVDVRFDGPETLVKGQIYQGDGPAAEQANHFWSSLTEITPPARWYPSVGGAVEAGKDVIDRDSLAKRRLITKVRWTNIGFSKTPVNQAVPEVSSVPFGALAKSFAAGAFDLDKALEAGYGSDVAALEGGAALRKQSLHGVPINYWDFRNRLAAAVTGGAVSAPRIAALADYAVDQLGISRGQAAEWVHRFLADLKHHLKRRSKQ